MWLHHSEMVVWNENWLNTFFRVWIVDGLEKKKKKISTFDWEKSDFVIIPILYGKFHFLLIWEEFNFDCERFQFSLLSKKERKKYCCSMQKKRPAPQNCCWWIMKCKLVLCMAVCVFFFGCRIMLIEKYFVLNMSNWTDFNIDIKYFQLNFELKIWIKLILEVKYRHVVSKIKF